jgi:hypothetical protein
MDTNQVLSKVAGYLQREAPGLDFGEIGFSVSVHKGDMRKLEFFTTVKRKPVNNPHQGPYHDDNSR